jgi:hypothetical protein
MGAIARKMAVLGCILQPRDVVRGDDQEKKMLEKR